MRKFWLKAYLAWALVVFTITMITLMPFMLLPYLFGERIGSKVSYFFMRWWAYSFVWPNGGLKFRIHGREHLNPGETYIFCANHNSFLDTPALVWAIKQPTKPLGKIEMTRIPIFGFIYKFLVVLVDRKNPESRRLSMVKMREQLNNGISVLIFPEGATNRTVEPVQPFFDGAFRIALDAQRPIVPVSVVGTAQLLPPNGQLDIKPGAIDIYIHKPIQTEGLPVKARAQLKESVFDIIRNTYLQHGGRSWLGGLQ